LKIVTLTLSPAFDRYCRAEELKLYKENLVKETCFAAGGKGINISRALQSADIPSIAVAVLGEENGQRFAEETRTQGLNLLPLWQNGRIRENITVATVVGETRISFPAAPTELQTVSKAFSAVPLDAGDVLTLTGRLPEGITAADILPFLKETKRKGVLLVIDSKSFSLKDLTDLRPWLIKPNEEEIADYCPQPLHDLSDAENAAALLHQKGIANVMISLGEKGAVLVNDEGAFSCPAPKVKVRSTVGAGDSSIAGFLTAHYRGLGAVQKLKYAVAFGSAACLSEGPLPPKMSDVQQLLSELK